MRLDRPEWQDGAVIPEEEPHAVWRDRVAWSIGMLCLGYLVGVMAWWLPLWAGSALWGYGILVEDIMDDPHARLSYRTRWDVMVFAGGFALLSGPIVPLVYAGARCRWRVSSAEWDARNQESDTVESYVE